MSIMALSQLKTPMYPWTGSRNVVVGCGRVKSEPCIEHMYAPAEYQVQFGLSTCNCVTEGTELGPRLTRVRRHRVECPYPVMVSTGHRRSAGCDRWYQRSSQDIRAGITRLSAFWLREVRRGRMRSPRPGGTDDISRESELDASSSPRTSVSTPLSSMRDGRRHPRCAAGKVRGDTGSALPWESALRMSPVYLLPICQVRTHAGYPG